MGIRDKLSFSMTQGADFRWMVFKSLGLALLCTLVAVPYFHHLLSVSLKAHGRVMLPDLNKVLIMQLFLLFIVCLLSAVLGVEINLENDRITKIRPWKGHNQRVRCNRGTKL